MSTLSRRLSSIAILAVVATSIPLVATASGSPVKINRCEAVQKKSTASSGYAAGYYPASGPYYWRDAYGRRYEQYPPPDAVSSTSPELQVAYTSTSFAPLVAVEFGLVDNGKLVAEMRDAGEVKYGKEIKHSFGLFPDIFPLGKTQCVVLRAVYKAGGVWTNKDLPPGIGLTLYH
jgi:hypothetical protein